MSRWLKSVNNLLETLDGKAETVADSQAIGKFLENGREAVAAAGIGGRRHANSVETSSDDDEDDDDYEEEYEEMGDEYDGENEEDFVEETIPEDVESEQPEGTGKELDDAIKASSDPNEDAVSLSLRRRRADVDETTVSDISFSEYTEEELEEDDEQPMGVTNTKTRPSALAPPPPSPGGSADAPPNPPNRSDSHPQRVEHMAKLSADMGDTVDPSSNHTPVVGQGVRPSRTAGAVRSAPSSSSMNVNITMSPIKALSPKVDESPRPPRRSVENQSKLPQASSTFLDDVESVTEGSTEREPEPVDGAEEGNDNQNKAPTVENSTAPPRLPSRQASFPTKMEDDKSPSGIPADAAPSATLTPVSGSPAASSKQGVAAAIAMKAAPVGVKPPPPPLTVSSVNPKQTKEYQKLKDKFQALQSQLTKTSSELKTSQTQVKALQTQNQTLESKLEAANSEIVAQSDELRRAGERMEKDRLRAQEEREDLLDEQDEELDQLKQTHQKELDGLRNQYEAQIEDLTQQLHSEETRRRQEGGDYTQELQDAIERERVALKQLHTVTTERTQFQTTVSKLELQQSALQSKLDSALQSVKTAAEREREAEDKLDAAMSLHSRQTTQRQTREAELENTIFELGTALTVARQKQQASSKEPSKDSLAKDGEGESFKDKYNAAAEEVETLKVQLNMETQRREALQEELNDISRERSEEASSAQARQRMHDRKVSDLESTVARLQATVQEQKSVFGTTAGNGSAAIMGADPVILSRDLQAARREIENLTTQLIRHQNMTENSKSEILALKGRLQAATSRAEHAEQSLKVAQSSKSGGAMSSNRLYEMEGGGVVGGVRRRIKGGAASRIRSRTIRSALQMGPGSTNHPLMEQAATTLDALDKWMVETGSFFRHEPLARLAFMLYLITLHLWSFALVVFHTTEQPHADFGSMDNNPRHWRAAVAAVQQQQQSTP